MKIRTTVMLDELVVRKLQVEHDNMSAFVNAALKKALFGEQKSMFGLLKGRISGKDRVVDED